MTGLTLGLASVAIAFGAWAAEAGTIHGQLWASRAAARLVRPQAAAPPTRAASSSRTPADLPALPAAAIRAQQGIHDAVVWVESIPAKAERRLARPPWYRFWDRPRARMRTMVQAHQRFTPRVMVAPVGTPVEFLNLDRVYHNVFSVSAARNFDLGRYAPGARDTVLFDRSGVANLHCDIHPDEIGFIVVVPNLAYARPDSLGRFSLPRLPEGEYALRAWHSRLGEARGMAVIPRRGDATVTLAF
jgi:plastocyanin